MTNLDQGQKNVFSTAATFWYATIKRKEWVYFQLVTAASPLRCPSYKLWYTKKKKRNYKVCSYKIIVRRENIPAAYYQKNYFSCCQLIYIWYSIHKIRPGHVTMLTVTKHINMALPLLITWARFWIVHCLSNYNEAFLFNTFIFFLII